MSAFVSVFCEIGATPPPRTAEIITRSSRCVRELSARVVSRACADERDGRKRAAASAAASRQRADGKKLCIVRLPTPVRTGSGSTGLSQPAPFVGRHPGRRRKLNTVRHITTGHCVGCADYRAQQRLLAQALPCT